MLPVSQETLAATQARLMTGGGDRVLAINADGSASIDGFCLLAADGGPPIRAEEVEQWASVPRHHGDRRMDATWDADTRARYVARLTDSQTVLARAIAERCDLGCEPVDRPRPGVAITGLPTYADISDLAQACDAERVVAAWVGYDGRLVLGVPQEDVYAPKVAHMLAKVIHLLLEIHTDYINAVCDADVQCDLPNTPEDLLSTRVAYTTESLGYAIEVLRTIAYDHDVVNTAVIQDQLAEIPSLIAAIQRPGLNP